ncbi:MAG: OFA family MFS transporter [Desulfitobacteriia bacterium]|jgi:OFA family oxalate/formate antiporter-like MFS transporter
MELSPEQVRYLTKRRWAVLVASCLINLCIGSMYAWSVFAAPMAEHLSSVTGMALTAGSLAIVFSIANSLGPITLISGGYINDKFGPKWVIFAGGVMYGSGLIISGFAKGIGMLIFGYGIVCGLAMGLVYGCTISNSVKFFPDRRGMVGGITTASYGISSVIISPIANYLIIRTGVTSAFKMFGLVFFILITIGTIFVTKSPRDFKPWGWTPPKDFYSLGGKEAIEKNWRGMLADPVFYVMILMLVCGANFGMMIISQASSIAQTMVNLSVSSATIVVSLIALSNSIGRASAGFISDKIGRINTLTIMLIVALGAMGLLFFCQEQNIIRFYISIVLIGLCFGSFMGVYPGFTADQFGSRNNSVNYGIMFIGFAIAGLTGPNIVAGIYSATNSYQPAFLVGGFLAISGLVLSVIYRLIVRNRKKEAVSLEGK